MTRSEHLDNRRFEPVVAAVVLAFVTSIAAQTIPEYNDPSQAPSLVSGGPTAPAAAASATRVGERVRKLDYEVDVPGASQWTDTGIDLLAGDRVVITGSGNMQSLAGTAAGPQGLARGWRDLLRALPVNGAGAGALIGRVGNPSAAVAFLVGSTKEVTVNQPGRLFLGINQLANEQSDGTFHVNLKIVPTNNTASVPPPELVLPSDFGSRFPRRVQDGNDKLGDLVNFIVIGSEEKLKAAFRDGGWVQVDSSKSEAVVHALLSSATKQSYVEMPMSELYLFGRVQDFGFARAEPIQVVQTRHHLRVWKAPFAYQGRTVWAGAATHDIGFEKDQRTGGVTHKIEPRVDVERDFVGECFRTAGALSATTYLTPSDSVREAHTATGGVIQSDGRVLVMMLGPGQP